LHTYPRHFFCLHPITRFIRLPFLPHAQPISIRLQYYSLSSFHPSDLHVCLILLCSYLPAVCQRLNFLSFLDGNSTSFLPDDDSTLNSTEGYELEDLDKIFKSLLRFSQFLHTNISVFSTEACVASENSGPCVYIYAFDAFVNGNETCSIYTIGGCDHIIKR
jgi:hypothetical protein